jgi:putative transposase
MSRYRLYPTPAQEDLLLGHCAHARYVWNLAAEQRSWWQPGRPAPGFAEQCRQLSQARASHRRWGVVLVPKLGWVRFRWSRPVPAARSYRVTRDRAGRWHVAFAAVPPAIPAPGNGEVVGVDRDYNAARNVAAAGQVVAARGGQGSSRPVNREPPTLGAVA